MNLKSNYRISPEADTVRALTAWACTQQHSTTKDDTLQIVMYARWRCILDGCAVKIYMLVMSPGTSVWLRQTRR